MQSRDWALGTPTFCVSLSPSSAAHMVVFLLSLILPFMVQYRNTLLRRSKMNGTKWAPARVTPFTIGTLMFLHNRLFDHRAMTFLRLHIFQISAYTNRAFGNCFNFNEIRSDLTLFYRISWSSFVGGLVNMKATGIVRRIDDCVIIRPKIIGG